VPGVSVAVIDDGKIAWAQGFGVLEKGGDRKVTTETLFQAASISKPTSAIGAMALVQAGKLTLDEDVNGKLKSWKIPDSVLLEDKMVTLRGLLSHTAGLTVHGFGGSRTGEPVATLLEVLNGSGRANSKPILVNLEPGAMHRYSGGGYCVMQQMVIDVSGKDFPTYMQEAVLAKLGMTRSTYEQPLPEEKLANAAVGHRANGGVIPGRRNVYPELAAAGLWTTPSDLARMAIEVQACLAGRSEKVLSQGMIETMLTPVMKAGDGSIGLGFFLNGEGTTATFSHGGGNEGFKCHLSATREGGRGVAIMTNSDRGQSVIAGAFKAIREHYREHHNWPK